MDDLVILLRASAVLGRFVYALNMYCKEAHGMDHKVEDFWIYEFAKVGSNIHLQEESFEGFVICMLVTARHHLLYASICLVYCVQSGAPCLAADLELHPGSIESDCARLLQITTLQ